MMIRTPSLPHLLIVDNEFRFSMRCKGKHFRPDAGVLFFVQRGLYGGRLTERTISVTYGTNAPRGGWI